MQIIREDSIDFAAYQWDTECKAKVRPASAFADDLEAEFSAKRMHSPTMFSTKLKHFMEFRPAEVTAWAGYSGHRKSMFTGQLGLELGIQGVKTLVASFEMTVGKTLARMSRQFAGLSDPDVQMRREFLSRTDRRVWLFDHVGRIDPQKMLAVARYFAEELGGQQVFIDSFMMVCGSEERMDEQKQFATDMVRLAQDTGLHVHIIAHCRKPASGDESNPPGKHDLRGTAAITDQCANVITVWANKAKEERLKAFDGDREAQLQPDAAITVCKQRNAEFEGRIKLFFDKPSLRFTDERAAGLAPWVGQKPGQHVTDLEAA